MSADDTELLKEFAVESQEHLADIENQLLTLESQGDEMDVALVNTVFRAIHSIKGAAGFMGLDTLGGLAHRAEEVLGKLRSNELRPTSVVINTLLRATDRLKELIDEVENSNGQDVNQHIIALEDILEGRVDINGTFTPPEEKVQAESTEQVACSSETSRSSTKAQAADDHEIGDTTSDSSQAISSKSASEALREFLVECFDNLEQVERDLLVLERDPAAEVVLNNVFRNMHTIKGSSGFLGFGKIEKIAHAAENLLAGVRASQFAFDAQISEALLGSIDTMRKLLFSIENGGTEGSEDHQFTCDFLGAVLSVKLPTPNAKVATSSPGAKSASKKTVENKTNSATKTPTTSTPKASPSAPTATIDTPKSESGKVDAGKSEKSAESKPASATEMSAADSTIRVDVALLDKLMTRVGELVLARNQILQFASTINDAALQNAVQRLNLITSELQEGVMKTRMQPIGNVWTKFPRLVRDLAAMCEKQVRIEMEGKETELDKTIIEAIKDPLTHLVRNTVDHGIEKPEVRRQVGKPIEGCLTLKAYHEGGQVNIEIVDDGGGLNIEKIKSKAVEKGLIRRTKPLRCSIAKLVT
ncbi:MAG: Hpt domain-containing protein [Pirellulales bacterium]